MHRQSRSTSILLGTFVLLGLTLAGFLSAAPLYAADGAARHQAVPAQETPAPEPPATDAGGGADGVDHAAHHPEAGQAITATSIASETTGMGGMMGSMAAMHGEMATMMAEMMAEHGADMSPEMAAGMGRMQGKMEGMGAMTGMMQHCPMMSGMMHGGMMEPGARMTDTMPMSGTMPGMMGMVPLMQRDMAAMMEQMPAGMAERMQQMHDRMGSTMSMMQGSMMQGMLAGDMGATAPMTDTMSGMQHGPADASGEPFDARFIDSMIEHHQGAIDMATQVLADGEHEALRAMAEEIIEAQTAEIEQMQEWRDAWYPDLPATSGVGMEMGDMELSEIESLPFDFRFLQAMISHHEGAVMMAQAALESAEHEEVHHLAQAIIDAQEAEIEQMQEWAAEWYPDLELPAGMDHGSAAAAGMPDMAAMHAKMDAMRAEMQGMMDEMMADEDTTPEMAAGMGRMMGRMESMANMSSMMGSMGGMMHCPMMSGMMDHVQEDDE